MWLRGIIYPNLREIRNREIPEKTAKREDWHFKNH